MLGDLGGVLVGKMGLKHAHCGGFLEKVCEHGGQKMYKHSAFRNTTCQQKKHDHANRGAHLCFM